MLFEVKAADLDRAANIKCVVWDLDNTLWQGTLLEGDDLVLIRGVEDVVRELDNRGILQSVASKNDYQAAWQKLTAWGLHEYFLHPQIGWVDKSDSLRTIADLLGLSLDTFALVDDQAFERDEVRHFLPEVATLEPSEIGKLLDVTRMQSRAVTKESRNRRKMYQAEIRRQQFEQEFQGSRQEFLTTLDMCLTIRRADEADLSRAEELTLRTSQLNTTGRAYSYVELKRFLNSSDHLLLVVDLEDRYGPSGTIGLVLVEQGADVWLIKLLLMSCRVMTRGIGGIIMSHILQSAKRSRVKLRGVFVANDRNRMMYVTYKFNGFYEAEAHGNSILLEHDLKAIRPFPPYVTVRADEQPDIR